jgi:hypothetical protein
MGDTPRQNLLTKNTLNIHTTIADQQQRAINSEPTKTNKSERRNRMKESFQEWILSEIREEAAQTPKACSGGARPT